jgi:hypothetical protein
MVFSSNLMNGRRYQMLRSGGVPAWLQLLGALGNRRMCVCKSFWTNPTSCRRHATAGGQMLGALESFGGGIEKINRENGDSAITPIAMSRNVSP